LRKSFRPSATDALIFYALIVVSFVIMRLAPPLNQFVFQALEVGMLQTDHG
jgi:hypothetical protein